MDDSQLNALSPEISVSIKKDALGAISAEQSRTARFSISPHAYAAGHVFKLVDKQITLRQAAALVFVDLKPQANWGHPCQYRFHDPQTGKLLYEEDALFPPDLTGRTTLETFHEPPITFQWRYRTVPWPWVPPIPWKYYGPFLPLQERYAILWTSQISNMRHVEDLEFLWRTLVNVYHFDPAKIYVLCYDGTVGATDASNPVGNWAGNNTPYQMNVRYSATVANLQTVFNTLAKALDPSDLLFIHTNNHGAPTGFCVDESSVVTPTQFGTMLAGLPAFETLAVTMEQCFSGAFQAPVIQQSTAKNTVFASAVDANKESDGAAHFDPWALALIEALYGALPSGGALPSHPAGGTPVSLKAACDWAKANDTGSDDDPQYADKPAGCGSNIALGS